MTPNDDHYAALVAGALAGDLDESERAELAALAAEHPDVAAELEELGATVVELRRHVPTWDDAQPPSVLRERVLGSTSARDAEPHPGDRALIRPRSWTARTVLAPAASFLVGVAVALGGVQVWQERTDGPPEGPPGTLGALEDVTLAPTVDGARIDGVLVAHTWGTETVLEIDGLPAGEGYAVVLIAEDGREYDSGTFIGSDVVIDCRMNAAVKRADAQRLEIRQDDGGVIAAANLPDAVPDGF